MKNTSKDCSDTFLDLVKQCHDFHLTNRPQFPIKANLTLSLLTLLIRRLQLSSLTPLRVVPFLTLLCRRFSALTNGLLTSTSTLDVSNAQLLILAIDNPNHFLSHLPLNLHHMVAYLPINSNAITMTRLHHGFVLPSILLM